MGDRDRAFVPRVFRTVTRQTAGDLAQTFKRVGYLGGQQNAPMPERNTVVHLGAAFLSQGYGVYAEVRLRRNPRAIELTRRNGRVDLVASNGRHTFVIEVSTFGRRRFDKVLEDVRRIESFEPQVASRRDGFVPSAFWEESERWGAVVIQSFAQAPVGDLWVDIACRDDGFEERVAAVPEKLLRHAEKPGILELAHHLSSRPAASGVELVCDGRCVDRNPLGLLWSVFPLVRHGEE